jgi:hypothetical protein
MNEGKLRAWWSHRQGLDGRLEGRGPGEVLAETGWARSVGGAGPYLTLHARAGASREDADAAAARLEIHEIPAARGCTYVVPARDFALGLRVGQPFGGGEMRTAAKLGVTEKEIARLCDAVLKALEAGPLDPEGIRERTGGASRNLGEAGKKKGLITTLPVALGKLQAAGEIRRVPVNGRLDQQRYQYTLWRPNPLRGFTLSGEEAVTELARRYFSWIGPATPGEFQWFSALGVKAAKAAMEPLKLVPLEAGSDRLMLPEDRQRLAEFQPPKQARYTLVSGLDGISLLRRDLKSLLDPADLKQKVFDEKGYVQAGALTDLPNHAIFDRGRLVGLWEYDPEKQEVVWMSFIPKNKDLVQAVKRTEDYVRGQLGDARSFSLDSPKSRGPRLAALRKAA